MEYRSFINNNISTLGYGLAKLPLTDGKIDKEKSKNLIMYAIKNGINFFDTAYTYLNGQSEEILGEVVKTINRKDIIISTKAPVWLYKESNDFDAILKEQLLRLNTDYIDCYLLHGLNYESWNIVKKHNILQKLSMAKKEGIIKSIGFSFQDNYQLFTEIIDSYCWDLCMLRINFLEPKFQAGIRGIEYAAKKNIKIFAMQPFMGGIANELFSKFHSYNELNLLNFKYILNNKNVISIIPSMTQLKHLKENINMSSCDIVNCSWINEIYSIRKEYESKLTIKCNGCFNCNCCSQQIAIPYIFMLYNHYKILNDKEDFLKRYRYTMERHGGSNINCNYCAKCDNVCPNGIDIICELAKIKQELIKLNEHL